MNGKRVASASGFDFDASLNETVTIYNNERHDNRSAHNG